MKDLSIKTWCRIYVRLPRWRTSLFTDTEKSQVAPDSQLSDPSFATLRPGQRARDITRVCVRQKFVFCQELICLALTISKRPSGSQGGNISHYLSAFWSPESCVVRLARDCGLCEARHRIIISQDSAPIHRRLPGTGPWRGERDIFHRPVAYNATRNAASCCNGKNKTFTLSLKPPGEWLGTVHNWQSSDEISFHTKSLSQIYRFTIIELYAPYYLSTLKELTYLQ